MKSLILLATAALCLVATSSAEDYGVPTKTDDNLIVATYNIQFLGSNWHDYTKLAKVISYFDVCGIQEVKNERALSSIVYQLEKHTGQNWGFAHGIRTHRPEGRYYEAFAVIWNRDRVEVADGLISNTWDTEETYRNDPFIASFQRKEFDFSMYLIHTRWSDDDEGNRENEVLELVDQITYLRSYLPEKDIMLMGDFNFPTSNEAMKSMASELDLAPISPNAKTTFKRDNSDYASSYDHIYISTSDTLEFGGKSMALDVTTLIYGDKSQDSMRLSKKELSDHLPVWAEFDVSGSDDDKDY